MHHGNKIPDRKQTGQLVARTYRGVFGHGRDAHRESAGLPAGTILERILAGMEEFTGDMAGFDDITLHVIRAA